MKWFSFYYLVPALFSKNAIQPGRIKQDVRLRPIKMQQLISGLPLQSAQIKDPQTVQVFNDSQSRLRSMALIHEKLYRSNSLARIDFRGSVQSLCSDLGRSFAVSARRMTFSVEVNGVSLDIDFQNTTSLGLQLVNLLVNQLEGFAKWRWLRF